MTLRLTLERKTAQVGMLGSKCGIHARPMSERSIKYCSPVGWDFHREKGVDSKTIIPCNPVVKIHGRQVSPCKTMEGKPSGPG
ncbi:hypothetical protein BTVI_60912 [Pitangus sulphuratus]|nr:hypothetical protein BTVI_60912 [Pitangus sulphuratus]